MFTKLAQILLVSVIGLFGLSSLWVFGEALYNGNHGVVVASFFIAIGAIILALFLAGRFFEKR